MRACSQWEIMKQFVASTFSSSFRSRAFSNNTASITRIHRENFLRMYKAVLIQPDGSSVSIRYHEPRSIVQLPLDISTLSAEEMKARLLKRNPKKKVVYTEDEKDTFKATKYIRLVKRAKQ